MNRVILSGEIGSDIVLKKTAAGQSLCNFSIEVKEKGKDGQERKYFFDCTVWGENAEHINQYGLSTHVTYEEQIQFEKKHISVYGLASVLADLIERGDGLVERTIAIGESLSFTIEEMFEEYKKKNKVNYQRLESGY